MSYIEIETSQTFDTDEILDMINNKVIKEYLKNEGVRAHDDNIDELINNFYSTEPTLHTDREIIRIVIMLLKNLNNLDINDVSKLEAFVKKENLI